MKTCISHRVLDQPGETEHWKYGCLKRSRIKSKKDLKAKIHDQLN